MHGIRASSTLDIRVNDFKMQDNPQCVYSPKKRKSNIFLPTRLASYVIVSYSESGHHFTLVTQW